MISLPKDQIPRYERKYLIPEIQAVQLQLYIEEICKRDANVVEEDGYNIRSIYFDDYYSTSYKDNEAGVDPRNKFRIRIYDCKDEYIALERKIKTDGKIYKQRARLSMEEYQAIMNDRIEEIPYPNENSLLNQFLCLWHTRLLRPVIIVDYDREPYVYEDGDVRITFDRNISFSDSFSDFFDRRLYLQPILPKGMLLLEVKYTEFLPEIIHRVLNRFQLKQCTFSKYYLSEKYKRMEGIYDI